MLALGGQDVEHASVRFFVNRVGMQYDVRSVLEGPFDGASSERGGHSLGLAARGVPAVVAVTRREDEATVQALYKKAAMNPPDVRYIQDPLAPGAIPSADLVVSFDATPHVDAWESYLAALARSARKVLVVIVRNPSRTFAGAHHPGRDTLALAHTLWAVGRVREHSYLGVPAVVVGLQRLRGRRFHADVIESPVDITVSRSARLHAFVVDTTPRTPQARRRLGQATT